jgi:hypothetical protein
MAIADDWTINYTAKTVTHTSGTTVYTVLSLYSWMMDVFDDASQMDDDVPMSAQTPTEFSLINGWTIPDASYPYLKGGAINDTTNDDLWAAVYTLGGIVSGAQIYIIQNDAEIAPWWSTGHIDVLVKVRDSGAEIDNGKLLLMIRDLAATFDHFEVDCTAGGRNAVPLATSSDLNNQTAGATLAGYSDITTTFGAVAKNLNNGSGAVTYNCVVNCAGRPLSQVYEYLKYVTRHNSASTINGDAGEEYLAAAAGYAEVKQAPFGTFAGGKFFGARGIWIENYDAADAKNFQLIDASGATQIPPNVVPVKVTSVVAGDRVAVFLLSGVGGSIVSALIDEAATGTTSQTTRTYTADEPVLIRVRQYGILPFEVESAITATGMSVAAIRTVDSIVS